MPDAPLVPPVPAPAVLPLLRARFAQARTAAEAALAQVDATAWTRPLAGPPPVPGPTSASGEVSAEGENTLAVLVHHVGGNLTSRFTDLLGSDGEKPWRHRDREFDAVAPDAARAAWERGWTTLFAALDALGDGDLGRTVTIRGAPMPLFDALLRALAHVHYHSGQIVLLAKHHAGAAWTPLTIPRGASDAFVATPFQGDAYRG